MEYLRSHSAGELFAAPLDVVFGPFDVVVPDLLLIAGDQVHILTDANLRGAPALVVEILSKSTRKRDRHITHALSARAGVHEYWMIDPRSGTIEVSRRAAEGTFPMIATLDGSKDDELTTPLLPGFSLALKEFFRA